jgi:hypothetical protein
MVVGLVSSVVVCCFYFCFGFFFFWSKKKETNWINFLNSSLIFFIIEQIDLFYM